MNTIKFLNKQSEMFHKIMQHVDDPVYLVFSDELVDIGAAAYDLPEYMTKSALMLLKKHTLKPLTYAEIDAAIAAGLVHTLRDSDWIRQTLKIA